MPGDQLPPRPDAHHPLEPHDRSIHVLTSITAGVNAVLGALSLAGWLGRPESCAGGCPWRPMGGMLWVLLAVVDVGLVLVWAGIGYLYLVGIGQRIGHRISDRGDGEQD
jgi:hypothetical protein